MHVALLDGHGLEQVERLALGDAFDDVDQDDIGQFLGGDPVGGSGAYVAGADNADFLPHDFSLFECMSHRAKAPVIRSAGRRRSLQILLP